MPATMDVKTLGPHLTAEQAEQIYSAGEEAVIFALLELAKMLAEQQQISRPTQSPAPSTPWRMIPSVPETVGPLQDRTASTAARNEQHFRRLNCY